jgi:hypothetical protein
MTIISHAITAALLAEGGIWSALDGLAKVPGPRAAITMNAKILGTLRHLNAGADTLARALDEKNIVLEPTIDPERFLAGLRVDADELEAIERHLMAIREDSVDLGYTSARVKYGFNRYAVDAAVESVQIAKDEIKEGGAA